MSPEEAKLLAGLFERIKANGSAPRDKEAESFIAEQVKAQPEAPYLLAQSVIVQDFALRAANEKIQQLEARAAELESQSKPSGGFLGGLFGGAAAPQPPPRPAPPPQSYAPPQGGPWGAPPQGYGQPGYGPGPGPGGFGQGGFGQGGFGGAPAPGGGFLKGALGTAAGVAGGVLLADSLRGLFHGGGGFGSGLGIDSGFQHAGLNETTIVNNYYEEPGGGHHANDASYDDGPNDDAGAQDADWDSGDYDDGGGDGGFDA